MKPKSSFESTPYGATQLKHLASHATPLFAIAAACLVASLIACSEVTGGPGQISQKLGAATSDLSAKEVDLAKLTSFGWDRLFLFKAGTQRKEICQFIGAKPGLCERVLHFESVPAESMALLFGLQGQLTHAEVHSLSNGRFDVTPTEAGIPKEACVFKIRRDSSPDGTTTVWLEPR